MLRFRNAQPLGRLLTWIVLTILVTFCAESLKAETTDAKSSYVSSEELDSSSFEQGIALFEEQLDDKALAIFSTIDSALSLSYQAEILMLSDLDKAEAIIEKTLQLEPDRGRNHFIHARIMAKQASNSFFSAFSYANRSLESFKRAAMLEPENIGFQLGLMMFYLNAPSIAGGGKELAEKVLLDIQALDREQGALAELRFIRHTKEYYDLSDLKQLIAKYPTFASVHYQLAQWFQFEKRYEEAFEHYAIAQQKLGDFESKLRCEIDYQFAKNAISSKLQINQGLQRLEIYIAECEIKRDMPNKEWAQYRYANLQDLNNQQDQAKSVYSKLQTTTDKELKKALSEHLRNSQ